MAFCFSCMPFQHSGSRRKTSKCMKLIKPLLCRLKYLEARRRVMVSHKREDIATLLKLGQLQRAFNMVEQLCEDQNRVCAYEVIREICECVAENLSCLTEQSDLPKDVNVAVSNIIFAASRCGEIPELNNLRNLFRDWYGNELEAANVNLLPKNLVKPELKKSLSAGSTSDDVKLELINEIIRDYAITVCLPQKGQEVYAILDGKDMSGKEDEHLNTEAEPVQTPKHAKIARILPDRIIQDALRLDLIHERHKDSASRTLQLNSQEVGDIYEEQYHRQQVNEVLKLEQAAVEEANKPETASIWIKTIKGDRHTQNSEKLSPRDSTDSADQIQEKEIVYLDDIKGSPPKSFCKSGANIQYLNSNVEAKRLPFCSEANAYRPLPLHTLNEKGTKNKYYKESSLDDNMHVFRTRESRKFCPSSKGDIEYYSRHPRQRA